ncbi:uncharacterized protein LOC117793677 [Drosophila innubila]|uniref:uncharacterized protein LOC117793677 n=1 Tax=Drosophila innubila TaxID=198719 RepID=UPI00148CE400|nr:uncharacterized protein LOC117793677 [Drosophila innubila]
MEELQALNNCEIFNQIRSVYSNYHNKVKKLNSFNFYSGNEMHIKQLISLVNNVLLEHDLVEQQEQGDKIKTIAVGDMEQLRGTMMYIILNSVHIKSEDHNTLARWNPQCVHLLNQWPAHLNQLVTVSLAVKCGLFEAFLEFLACGPHWLTSQYLDCFNENLSHLILDRLEMLPLMCGTLKAVSKAICYQQTQVNLMPNAMRLLQRHLLDTEERLTIIKSSRGRHRYLGEAMRQLLDVILNVIEDVDKEIPLPAYFYVYELRLKPLKLEQEREMEQAQQLEQQQQLEEQKKQQQKQQQLYNLAAKLMDTLQRLLPLISVNTYMDWQDLPSGSLIFHLQAHICNQCQQLLQLLNKHNDLNTHSLCKQLVNFAEGAQSFEQRLEMLTIGELLSFLDGELGEVPADQLLKGLNQLFKRSIAFGSDECIETMTKHVKLLDLTHAHQILDHLLELKQLKELEMEQDEQLKLTEIKQEQEEEQQQDNEEDYDETYDELLNSILLPIYKSLANPVEKLQLLEKRQQLTNLRFQLENSTEERIFFFNNLSYIKQQFPLHKFLDLSFVEPQLTWLSLAQLALTHVKFNQLFTEIAVKCQPHFKPPLEYVMQHLMLDERLLKHCQSPTQDFLLQLYILSIQLNLNSSLNELQLIQHNYLSSMAAGLAKFTDTLDYAALGRLLHTLLQLEVMEKRYNSNSRQKFKLQRQRAQKLPLTKQKSKLMLAKKSALVFRKLGWWRSSNWTLTFQLIHSMDALRGDLETFDLSRIQVLDLIVKYHIKNYPRFLISSPNQSVDELLQTLKHKQFWKDDQLAVFLEKRKFRRAKEYASLLTQSSTLEAIKLLSDAIYHKIDWSVMYELSQTVDLTTGKEPTSIPSLNAVKAYGFIFKCYMEAFNDVLIKPNHISDYPYLIEHLVQTPKLLLKENLLLAVNNFKTLLNTTEEHVSEEQILQLVNLKLSKSVDN